MQRFLALASFQKQQVAPSSYEQMGCSGEKTLVCSSICYENAMMLWTRCLKQHLAFTVLEAGHSKVTADQMSSDVSLLSLKMLSSHCFLTGVGREIPFYTGADPHHEFSTLMTYSCPKDPTYKYHPIGDSVSSYELWGDKNLQFTAISLGPPESASLPRWIN